VISEELLVSTTENVIFTFSIVHKYIMKKKLKREMKRKNSEEDKQKVCHNG